MTLSYRGIQYDQPSLALDTTIGEIKGKYRGQDWHHHYPRPLPQRRIKPAMTYRGVPLSDHPSFPPVAVGSTCPVSTRQAHKVVSNDLSRVHFNNIRKSLEKRLAIAQDRGDSSLIQLLESEYEQLRVL
jgi:hypothetical protein